MQEKIGNFILELRKERNMTQQELASKLNVTDRAVSHWENGRSVSDVSLFKSICEIFDISVNELVNGKRKSKENHFMKYCIFFLIFVSTILLIILVVIKNKRFEIDNFKFQVIDEDIYYSLTEKITVGDKKVYSYGVDYEQVCDKNEQCYLIYEVLKNGKVTLDDFENYLNRQVEYKNYSIVMLNDKGTKIYTKNGVTIIYCNTFDNNHDVYIGNDKMLDDLKGNYCGFSFDTIKNTKVDLNELKDVYVNAVKGSITKSSIKIQIYDKKSENYVYGSEYTIDKKVNGKWERLNTEKQIISDSMGYEPDINGILYFNIDWYYYYGNLDSGTYRIVKYAHFKDDKDCNPECNKIYYSVEFNIE